MAFGSFEAICGGEQAGECQTISEARGPRMPRGVASRATHKVDGIVERAVLRHANERGLVVTCAVDAAAVAYRLVSARGTQKGGRRRRGKTNLICRADDDGGDPGMGQRPPALLRGPSLAGRAVERVGRHDARATYLVHALGQPARDRCAEDAVVRRLVEPLEEGKLGRVGDGRRRERINLLDDDVRVACARAGRAQGVSDECELAVLRTERTDDDALVIRRLRSCERGEQDEGQVEKVSEGSGQ